MNKRRDMLWATLGEGGLVLALAAIAWGARQPFIFASLGPTIYELVEQPQLRSAKAYNIVVGHFVGLGAGFLAIFILGAWHAPQVILHGFPVSARIWCMAVAAAITTLVNLAIKAGQPAALATTLLVSLGAMQTERDALAIIAGVIILAIIGEPVRRIRLKYTQLRPAATTP